CRVLRIHLLERPVRVDMVVEIAWRLLEQAIEGRGNLRMTGRLVVPIFVSRDGGSDRTNEQRVGLAAVGKLLDQRLVGGAGQDVHFDQNDLRQMRLVRDDLEYSHR